MSVTPRERGDRMRRRRKETKCVGGGAYTCPRCGWECKHLVMPYYDSPWREFGGICGECCVEAAKHFEANGWPERLPDDLYYRFADAPAIPVQESFDGAETVVGE